MTKEEIAEKFKKVVSTILGCENRPEFKAATATTKFIDDLVVSIR